MEWKPIETAPKNGNEILLFGPCYRDRTGHYAPDVNVGWWGNGIWQTRTPDEEISPTHWMPLPAAPN